MRRIGAYEAKTHLPRLLDAVEAGEAIEITKHGRTVAVLVPPDRGDRERIRGAIADLRAFAATHRLEGVSVRELIEEGRR